MAIGRTTSNSDPTARRSQTPLFPGRELPPPGALFQLGSGPGSGRPRLLPNPPQLTQPANFPPPLLPPPPPGNHDRPHVVWMLDCTHCGKFITNRGMMGTLNRSPDRQVLSTDALPLNCSADYSHPSESRICQCLCQKIFCHGCGAELGYMIVAPCAICASALSYTLSSPFTPPRITQAHRFIFFESEVDYEERLHFDGDPDVDPHACSQEIFDALARHFPLSQMPKIPPIRPGEFLYWHHFVRFGDMRGGVRNDVRARATWGYRVDPVNGGQYGSNQIMAGR